MRRDVLFGFVFFVCVASGNGAEPAQVTKYRSLTNWEGDEYGEGAGYRLRLWKTQGKIIGWLAYSEGPSPSDPNWQITSVIDVPTTGHFEFCAATLSQRKVPEPSNQEGSSNQCSLSFKGKMTKSDMSGTLKGGFGNGEEKITLAVDQGDFQWGMEDYKDLVEWESKWIASR